MQTSATTFGIEIEAIGLSLTEAAEAISLAGVRCFPERYGHSVPNNWKVVTDMSLSGGQGFEVVSPVLSGEEGIRQVRIVMDALKAAGAKVNKSCGMHVHIGARSMSLRQIKNVAKNYIVYEDFFDSIVPPSRRENANQYIKSNRYYASAAYSYDHDAAGAALRALDAASTIDEVINTACRNGDRYFKLNLTAFWRQRTIEFRQHSGTVDADKAETWIRLLLAFVEKAARSTVRPRQPGANPPASRIFAEFCTGFVPSPEVRAALRARRAQFRAPAAAAA